MDKMKETVRILIMLTFLFIFMYVIGGLNLHFVGFHETADPALPYVVTADGKSLSLLSGYENLQSALGDYLDGYGYAWEPKLVTYRYDRYCCVAIAFGYGRYEPSYSYFVLDPYGKYPDDCSTYNGITTASTNEELEAVFGTDCLKTDDYSAEVFIDGKEVDYSKKQDYPADFYGFYFSFDDWFEYIKKKYPNADTITVLICRYYDDYPNEIEFYIYPESF